MRTYLPVIGLGLLLTSLAMAADNSLTPQESQQGWKLLFDGKSPTGWRAIKKQSFPSTNWVVADGWLQCLGKGGGDIVSLDQYDQFELTWDWKLEQGGNSGLKYFVLEERGPIGHEYQMLDDALHPDAKLGDGKRVTGSFYDVLKPQVKTALAPSMDVNHSRILVKGNHVEHWLNGARVLEYELGSPETLAAVDQSKFKNTKPFGVRLKGRILLQDHNSLVWFRNMKIRETGDPAPSSVPQ